MDHLYANNNLNMFKWWSLTNPTTNLALVISIGLIIEHSATPEDITVDALRIEQIGEHEGKSTQAGAAMAVVGYGLVTN